MASQKLLFIVQDLVKNTSLGAGLLVVRNNIPSGIHFLGSSEGGIWLDFFLLSLWLLSLATLLCTLEKPLFLLRLPGAQTTLSDGTRGHICEQPKGYIVNIFKLDNEIQE